MRKEGHYVWDACGANCKFIVETMILHVSQTMAILKMIQTIN